MPGSSLTAWNLLTATGALLAFLIGLMGLIGRERKSPYVTNTVLIIFVVCLVGAAVDLISLALPCRLSSIALKLGLAILLISFILSAGRTYRIITRLLFFVDHISWKNAPIVRDFRRWKASLERRPRYEHSSRRFPDSIERAVNQFAKQNGAFARVPDAARAIAIRLQYIRQLDSQFIDLALTCLGEGVTVQYLTASRHPIEFVESLKRTCEDRRLDFSTLTTQLVVIDAYSPHYAFLDSIYPKKSIALQELGVANVVAKMTFAGVHTAASRAFNLLKGRVKADRLPALLIYEDLWGISDLESAEQYRIFIRHVLPSERLFGGMITIFVETSQPNSEWELVQAHADIVIDMTAPKGPA